jgi:hypothetical protein
MALLDRRSRGSQQDALIALRAFDLATQQGNALPMTPFTPYAEITTASPGFFQISALSQPGSIVTPGANIDTGPLTSFHAAPTLADVNVTNPPGSRLRDYMKGAQAQPPGGDAPGSIDPNVWGAAEPYVY